MTVEVVKVPADQAQSLMLNSPQQLRRWLPPVFGRYAGTALLPISKDSARAKF
jgi:hypothetical protein